MAGRKKRWSRKVPPGIAGGYLLSSSIPSLMPDNRVEMLVNGTAFFPSMLEALAAARESVYMDFYMINDDKTGNAVGEVIREKAKKGCEVCVIYDGIGSYASEEYFKWLNSAGVQTEAFHPVQLLRSKIGINRRDHRKMVVIDGRTGFLGGLNIAEEYGHPEKAWEGWRDTAVKVQGPVVRQMTSLFVRSWTRLGRTIPEHAKRNLAENVPEEVHGGGGVVHASVAGTEKIRGRREIIRAYRKALWSARRSIYIQSAYFLPPFSMRLALRRAVKRGIGVKIIVPLHGDVLMTHFASRSLFARLMRAGVELYQLPGPNMHTKTAVIDGVWSTVGSFNLNHRSFLHDLDINLLVIDEAFGASMERCFMEDLSKTIPVDPRKWRERPLNEKIVERFCYALRYWL
jgi:cardiolipin synthase